MQRAEDQKPNKLVVFLEKNDHEESDTSVFVRKGRISWVSEAEDKGGM